MRIDLSKIKTVVIIDENGKVCDEFILSSVLYIQNRSKKNNPCGELRLKKHKQGNEVIIKETIGQV